MKFLEALNDNNRGEDISDQRLFPRRYGLHQVGAPKPFPGLTGMLTWKKVDETLVNGDRKRIQKAEYRLGTGEREVFVKP